MMKVELIADLIHCIESVPRKEHVAIKQELLRTLRKELMKDRNKKE